MNITVEPVKIEEKEILKNLLEKYLYEFSQWEKEDVNNLGLYGYDYLDHYWTEKNRFPFFIKVEHTLAGFVMINDYPESDIKTDYTMSEFFIMHKYRCLGIGTYTAHYLFDKFKGKWQLKYHPKNTASEQFWIKVVNECTKGNYEIIKSKAEDKYKDGTIGNILVFEIDGNGFNHE
ncbi:hypothetical protein FACS1894172_16420 [Spirochaetia bacterium]|nr:hypothetical protein FACS1894164_09510 [Spirochaetia bacterium]GHU35120.1 hypothetical protein FACS1894172_16420 [Spirochaetia bacterium]